MGIEWLPFSRPKKEIPVKMCGPKPLIPAESRICLNTKPRSPMTRPTFAVLLLLSAGVCHAETFDIISRPAPPAGVDAVIRIDRPNPKQPSTEYPAITFQPGDTITIHAGGCVQSGGLGRTWHRYVNPSGPDTDRLYHGLVTIPFATGVLERVQKYWNQSVHIADTAPAASFIFNWGSKTNRADTAITAIRRMMTVPMINARGQTAVPHGCSSRSFIMAL